MWFADSIILKMEQNLPLIFLQSKQLSEYGLSTFFLMLSVTDPSVYCIVTNHL